jgi:DNA (cytosine-5)-methyltransferase 1
MTLHLLKPKSPSAEKAKDFSFLEFFAGGGMARAGLGCNWDCLFANDFDSKKADIYRQNWGNDHLHVGDVAQVEFSRFDSIHDVDLAWASFPCQDLSLAGNQAGLGGNRSGSFWGFWSLMAQLRQTDRHPKTIVLENVYGAVTSNRGRDFATLLDTLRDGGYKAGALVIDAVHFVPHSRPRLFIVAVRGDLFIPSKLSMQTTLPHWTPTGLSSALREFNFLSRKDWIYWKLPLPPARQQNFSDLIDEHPDGVHWHTAHETQSLLEMMSPANRKKVHQAQLSGRKMVGTLYKRTRVDSNGTRRQRAEVRFDDVAGCLRTPGGGSSRQTIVVVDGKSVRSRLLAPREAARLMGLSENYIIPKNYNEAYQLAGDGVVVPVVRHLAEYLLEPLLRAQSASRVKIA